MSIQQSLNQALFSISRAKIGKKVLTASQKYLDEDISDAKIAEVEAEQEARNIAAQKDKYKDAQQQNEVQNEVKAAAAKLKEKDSSFGFYTNEPKALSFGEEVDPMNLGDPRKEFLTAASLTERMNTIRNIRKGMEERMNIVRGGNQ